MTLGFRFLSLLNLKTAQLLRTDEDPTTMLLVASEVGVGLATSTTTIRVDDPEKFNSWMEQLRGAIGDQPPSMRTNNCMRDSFR